MLQALTQAKTKTLTWMIFDMTKFTQERIDEINAEMKSLNDAFVLEEAATDFEYLQAYATKMKALSNELMPLLMEGVK